MNKKNKPLLAALITEVVLAAIIIIKICIPSKSYNINPGQSIELPFGHYYVTCYYDAVNTDEQVNYLYIQNDNKTIDGIPQTENYLRDDQNQYTAEFWIYNIKKNINFSVRKFLSDEESDLVNIEKYELQKTPYVYFVILIPLMFIIAVTIWRTYLICNNVILSKDKIARTLMLVLTMIISCIPLFMDEVIVGHDTEIHLLRLEGIKDGYLAGQFPVRVEPTFLGGYGYAFSTFYGSLLYNIPAIFRLMGFSIQFSYKIYVAFINIATVLISYYCFKVMLKNKKNAVIATMLYSLSVHRFYVLYQRGAVGEFTALAFLPLIVIGLWKIYTLPSDKALRKQWVMPVIGFWGVIQSHVLSTEIYGGFTILLCLILFKKTFEKNRFIVLLKVVGISVILNAGYLLPFLESFLLDDLYIKLDKNYTAGLQGVPLVNIFKFYTGKADNSWNIVAGGLGCTAIIVVCLLLYVCCRKLIKKADKNEIIITGVISLISIIMSSDIVPWSKLIDFLKKGTSDHLVSKLMHMIGKVLENVQFPIRYLTIASFVFVVFTCFIIFAEQNDKVLKIGRAVIVGVTIFQFVWLSAVMMKNGTKESRYAVSPTDKDFTFNIGSFEYMPLKSDHYIPYMDMFWNVEECQLTNAKVSAYHKYLTNIDIHITTAEDNVGMVEFPLLYYRGYKAVNTDTGEKIDIHNSASSARVSIIVPAGFDSNVRVYYAGKLSWHIAEVVSVITFILIVVYGASSGRRGKNDWLIKKLQNSKNKLTTI